MSVTESQLCYTFAALHVSHDWFFVHFAPCKVNQESLRFWSAHCDSVIADFLIPRVEFQIPKPRIPDSTSKIFKVLEVLKPGYLMHSKMKVKQTAEQEKWVSVIKKHIFSSHNYYLHGAQLASAFYCFRIEPPRDHHSLKDPGKDTISILCRTYWWLHNL